jgi:hypothetical protein
MENSDNSENPHNIDTSTDTHTPSLLPWKLYLTITAETLLAFYLTTFCLALFFTHHGLDWIFSSILLVLLYLFVIIVCAKRVISSLPLQAIMLIIPIAPLLALITVVSLIPVLQNF